MCVRSEASQSSSRGFIFTLKAKPRFEVSAASKGMKPWIVLFLAFKPTNQSGYFHSTADQCLCACVCVCVREGVAPQRFMKPCIISSGSGKMMVEFFSAAMVLRVCR